MLVSIGASEESLGDPTALVSYIYYLFFIKIAKDLSCFVEYYVVILSTITCHIKIMKIKLTRNIRFVY